MPSSYLAYIACHCSTGHRIGHLVLYLCLISMNVYNNNISGYDCCGLYISPQKLPVYVYIYMLHTVYTDQLQRRTTVYSI